MYHKSSLVLFAILLQSCRAQTCTDYDLRLVGGQVPNEGRVEICVNQQWGTVCDDSWGDPDAEVVCRQLGYPTINATPAQFSEGNGEIFLGAVECNGNESRLIDCSHLPVGVENCSHHEDAGVHCALCQTGSVRLVDGLTEQEGRVEVCINEAWGTVCDDDWDAADASIVCLQLGYSPTNATAFRNARFGQGQLPILMDNVACQGPETRLIDCAYDEHTIDCFHSEDAGVHCQPLCRNGDIRLVGGASQRVEVCMGGGWSTACANDLREEIDLNEVCERLKFSCSVIPNRSVSTLAAVFMAISGYLLVLLVVVLAVLCWKLKQLRQKSAPGEPNSGDLRNSGSGAPGEPNPGSGAPGEPNPGSGAPGGQRNSGSVAPGGQRNPGAGVYNGIDKDLPNDHHYESKV